MLYRPFDYVFYFRVPDEAIRVFAVCQEAVELKKSFSFGVAEPELVHESGERVGRSEEHTSELQSLRHFVCGLLLEKRTSWRCRRRQKTGGCWAPSCCTARRNS